MRMKTTTRRLIRFGLPVMAAFAIAGATRLRAVEYDIRRDATVLAVEQVMPSVVNIATKNVVEVNDDPMAQFFEQFYGPYYRKQPDYADYSIGSGVIIDEAGY